MTILSLIVIGEKDYLCIIFSTLVLSLIEPNGKFSSIAFSFPPLILIIDILSFWGFPFSIWLIYFWGLPFVIITFILEWVGKPKLNIFAVIFLGILLIINQVVLYSLNPINIKVIKADQASKIEGPSENLIKNLSDKASLIDTIKGIYEIETGSEVNKWVIMAPSTPKLNDVYIRSNAGFGEYYIFGEHDDLGEFVERGSVFNIDSYRRKGPWHSFRPIMSRSLQIASNKDPIYSSNIGCTLRHTSFGYPLIWDYSPYGIPILLSRGEFHISQRLTCIGESDPIAKPLVSYNPNFLQAFLNQSNISEIWKGILLLISAFLVLFFKLKRKIKLELVVIIIALSGFLTAYSIPNSINQPQTPIDVSFKVYGPWLSPHYETHYSNLPKILSQNDLTVAIDQPNRSSKLSIVIVSSGKHSLSKLMKHSGPQNIIFITPQTIIMDGKKVINVEDVPLTKISKEIYGKEITIFDGRRLIINGNPKDCVYIVDDHYVIIATNSPQLTKGLESLVKTKNQ